MTLPLQVSIDGFSGPLDLLCSLVESRQMQASKIKVAQLVKIYGAYLAHTQNASAEVIAEFFFMAAGLLLQKVLSLLPSQDESEPEIFDGEDVISEEELLARMARFRPYREATSWLQERKAKQDRTFRRITEQPTDETPIYELGDLYSLCKLWWELLALSAAAREKAMEELFGSDDTEWDGVPGQLPDEAQIQNRIDEISEKLKISSHLTLTSLLTARSVSILVVTILALLEMCRMKKISILQEEAFGEVRIDSIIGDGIAD